MMPFHKLRTWLKLLKGVEMTYTILEAEYTSGIPSRRIRFWLDKGLFPNIYKDKNGTAF